MRCMHSFYRLLTQARLCQHYALITVVFFSFGYTVSDAIAGTSVHATHLIHQYISTHTAVIARMRMTQDGTIQSLDRLQQIPAASISASIHRIQPKNTLLPFLYPVQSSALSPGTVRRRKIQATLPAPMFIVGTDTMSTQWLNQYNDQLVKLHAKGFVVNVRSQSDMHHLRQEFPKLSFYPMPGNALATWLQITHYPVLISDKLIEQ